MAILITCITKPQGHFDHSAIIGFGWKEEGTTSTGWIAREDLWSWLTHKKGSAYTKDAFGTKAFVYPRENDRGTKFVQTIADGKYSDNLLYQQECVGRY